MKKPMLIMLILLSILFSSIFIYKGIKELMTKRYLASQSPVITVSALKANYSSWQPRIKAVGSLRAVLGVNITAELAGMIKTIYFTPGAIVQAGTPLVQQNADADIAQLHALEANAKLAEITYERDKLQFAVHAISKQQLDIDEQNLKSLRAQVAQQAATVIKLTIKAPFKGRLGISNVNPGQYLNPGDQVVTLQKLDSIYADFYLPQQLLAQLRLGEPVTMTTDTFPGQTFTGKITTINPLVETSSRNVKVEATIANPHNKLVPGMFTSVTINTGSTHRYLTLPITAISFNPYGEIAYLIKETSQDKQNQPILIANQVFVTTGETRGDQIAILKGIKEGDWIVTSGQLKLKNGSHITVNNSVEPSNHAMSVVTNEHQY
jgi:membrane fusion protein (multidrug efflux system)